MDNKQKELIDSIDVDLISKLYDTLEDDINNNIINYSGQQIDQKINELVELGMLFYNITELQESIK